MVLELWQRSTEEDTADLPHIKTLPLGAPLFHKIPIKELPLLLWR